jgi:hypothetical protein
MAFERLAHAGQRGREVALVSLLPGCIVYRHCAAPADYASINAIEAL